MKEETLKRGRREALAVQWLGHSVFTATALVQSLVGELRSHKLCGTAKKISKFKKQKKFFKG